VSVCGVLRKAMRDIAAAPDIDRSFNRQPMYKAYLPLVVR
jgi:hypothetical protein